MPFHRGRLDPKLSCQKSGHGLDGWINDIERNHTYGYKMQTEIADEMIENGIETDS